jgi:hypothetical protein
MKSIVDCGTKRVEALAVNKQPKAGRVSLPTRPFLPIHTAQTCNFYELFLRKYGDIIIVHNYFKGVCEVS